MSDTKPDTQQKFYLTTPIYYVNARPHIGHAYTTIAADVIARRHRLLGDDTFLLTGTDEHGQKIQRSADAAGIPPQQFADQVSASFRALWDRMGITYNDYIRTTDERHKKGVQKLFQLLCDRDKIYLSSYTGQYSIGEEMFVEGPPGTIGPDGKPTETITEENYFFRLSEYQRPIIDLIESGKLSIQPEVRRNEVLSFLRGNVSQASEQGAPGPDFQTSDGTPQSASESTIAYSNAGTPYLPGALKDLSISRTSFKWGIPVPGNPQTEQDHVIYVWLDALANYMTAIGYGSDDPADQAKFEKYWPADLHLVGKEIIRFHCVYWPAFLLAAGLPLPKAITAHGWLLFEDSKMSKSRGNIVRTETILEAFGTLKPDSSKAEQDLFASDVLRYFLLREIPFGQDGSFSFDALLQRYNSDLANGYGNLVSRTLSMIEKYSESAFEDDSGADADTPFSRSNESVTSTAIDVIGRAPKSLDSFDFSRYLDSVFGLVSATDAYITAEAPWKIASARAANWVMDLMYVLYTATESIRVITALLYPVLPHATSKVWSQLGLGSIEEASKRGDLRNLQWGQLDDLKPGTKLGPLSPIFPRAPKELIQLMNDMETPTTRSESPLKEASTPTPAAQIHEDSTHPSAPPRTSALNEQSPGTHVGASDAITTERPGTPPHHEAPASAPFAASAAGSAIPDTPQIAIDDFVKVDLRVAKILVAERIPKADKLLRLEVDLGYEKRQILSGIAEWYTPEELIGRRIVVIANLAPRKMRGLESHGMLLAASNGESGKPILATFGEDIELGSRVR